MARDGASISANSTVLSSFMPSETSPSIELAREKLKGKLEEPKNYDQEKVQEGRSVLQKHGLEKIN